MRKDIGEAQIFSPVCGLPVEGTLPLMGSSDQLSLSIPGEMQAVNAKARLSRLEGQMNKLP